MVDSLEMSVQLSEVWCKAMLPKLQANESN